MVTGSKIANFCLLTAREYFAAERHPGCRDRSIGRLRAGRLHRGLTLTAGFDTPLWPSPASTSDVRTSPYPIKCWGSSPCCWSRAAAWRAENAACQMVRPGRTLAASPPALYPDYVGAPGRGRGHTIRVSTRHCDWCRTADRTQHPPDRNLLPYLQGVLHYPGHRRRDSKHRLAASHLSESLPLLYLLAVRYAPGDQGYTLVIDISLGDENWRRLSHVAPMSPRPRQPVVLQAREPSRAVHRTECGGKDSVAADIALHKVFW